MLIEDFFEAVERAFIEETCRIPAPRRLELTSGTTANTTRNLANLTNQEQRMGLCEQASKEQDQAKLGVLFEGILRLLQDRQEWLNTAANGVPHDTPPLISKLSDSQPLTAALRVLIPTVAQSSHSHGAELDVG